MADRTEPMTTSEDHPVGPGPHTAAASAAADDRPSHPRGDRGTATAPSGDSLSVLSTLAGALCAFGLVFLLGALAAAVAGALDTDIAGLTDDEWRNAGIGGAVALAIVLFLAFAFGGYTAGRMAGRAGLRHGLVVFAIAVVVVAAAGIAAGLGADTTAVGDELRDQGIPTDTDTWTDIGIGAGIAAVVAVLAGAVLGGWRGEPWHARPVARGQQAARSSEEIVADARSRRDDDDRPAERTDVDQRDDDRPAERTDVDQRDESDTTTTDDRPDLDRTRSLEEERSDHAVELGDAHTPGER
jgi:hypothetical protein